MLPVAYIPIAVTSCGGKYGFAHDARPRQIRHRQTLENPVQVQASEDDHNGLDGSGFYHVTHFVRQGSELASLQGVLAFGPNEDRYN